MHQYDKNKMKVVVFHDWVNGMRGGERVLEAILEMFPDATLYTLFYEKNSSSKIIEQRKIITHWANNIPFIRNNYRMFLPLFPFFMETFYLKDPADLVISTSHCVIKGFQNKASAYHISYIHSPMRYIYDQFDSYFVINRPWYNPQRIVATLIRRFLQSWDRMSNNNVDYLISNSKFVQERIHYFYNLPSTIIHPFVDLEDFAYIDENNPNPIEKKNYFIMVTALAPNKRVDLAIEAFQALGPKYELIIIGVGQLEKELKDQNIPNITFLGSISRKVLIDYLSKAKALIFPGVEDFGITPLESLAALTPVIAFAKGGVLETLNNTVADFFYEENAQSLKIAIENFNDKRFNPKDLKDTAKKFSRDIFKEKFKQLIYAAVLTK